jgi:hypothetical protein
MLSSVLSRVWSSSSSSSTASTADENHWKRSADDACDIADDDIADDDDTDDMLVRQCPLLERFNAPLPSRSIIYSM